MAILTFSVLRIFTTSDCETRALDNKSFVLFSKVGRSILESLRINKPHLTQDTNGKVTRG